MGANDWQQSLNQAEEEWRDALIELEKAKSRVVELEDRVNALREAVDAITRLCTTQAVDANPGLKDMCLMVIQASETPLSVPEVRAALTERGFKLDYKNPLAVLHTTIKRLEKAGDIRLVKMTDGATKYERDIPF